ncbi:histidinol dehydrogenase [Gammaproteobacteria bacterium]|nr:histidinol dehydrogenase [Gammaproteobacteria bacterium]MDC1149633.1 histidinol dehydrogenase [Gammaproteobacteria bacterium]MDC3368282.1 histidinol dehydrogenase [Gammaproteobacteria bacterium]
MKNLTLRKNIPTLDFKESKLSRKDINTINKFKSLVINNGDDGLKEISKILKEKPLNSFKVTKSEFKKADKLLNDDIKNAILIAYANIKKYHEKQLEGLSIKDIETTKGIKLWSEFKPIDVIGLYIPGGTAPLFSSFLMQAIPAIIAGCNNIVVCTPPNKNGNIDPAILWVADLLNIKNIYKVGGSQAVFAMAYGTKSIPKCLKIFGPGNQYVTEAKMLVSKDISIDMPAGPSEVYVVSNDENKLDIIASDLLSQLEHSKDAKAVLISQNKSLIKNISNEINIQNNALNRQEILKSSINNIYLVNASSDQQVIDFININAPEHLILLDNDFSKIAPYINNAGSVFCGNYSPESFGDYASGSNHTLPTSGAAKTYSGLSVKDFGKIITFQTATAEGFMNLAPAVKILAEAENLDAHAKAVDIREKYAIQDTYQKPRTSFIKRTTNETSIFINLNIDGTGNYNVDTGLKYFDHMLEQFAKHGSFDITINSIGDLEIDEHHTIEDVAIALGDAFKQALGERKNIERYSSNESLVMDETISNVSIDMSSRNLLKMKTSKLREYVGDFPTEMFEHFFISFVNTLSFTCHIDTKGTNSHHIVEATFKSFTRALSTALIQNNKNIASTKGML